MNVLIMAGTSDARKIIKGLSTENGVIILATATTSHGAQLARDSGASDVLEGRFASEELADIIRNNDIELLIDATHPFAAAATQNAIKASNSESISYIRFERPETELPVSDLIHVVNTFEDAALIIKEILDQSEYLNKNESLNHESLNHESLNHESLNHESLNHESLNHESLNQSDSKERNSSKSFSNGKVLHLAGVNTLHYITEVISPELVVARVLPTVYSVKKSLELGIPHDNIIAMEGTFSPRFNGILMEEFQIKVVLTKESGQSGGTISKIQAALMGEVPVVIVMRPEIEELKGKLVFNEVELLVAEVISRSCTES